MYRKTTLKNGLRIISVPAKEDQAVTVLILVGTGSKYEKKETSGISHFLEHMYFKGTKKRPDQIAVAETLDRVGGIYNAFTGEEYTGYFAKVASSHFRLALDWVSDIFLNSTLPSKEIEKEKGVIIEEINMYHDNPMSHVELLWTKLLYGDQPAGWDIAGNKKTVSAIGREKLAGYKKSQYTAPNTVVCLSGNINEKKAIIEVKKYFGGVSSKNSRPKAEVKEMQREPGLILKEKETNQTHIHLGVRSYNIFHPRKYALDLMAAVLGGMMSSRLFTEIRGKLGLAYYINTASAYNSDTGYLTTNAGIDNGKTDLAISTILKEYRKIVQKKVGEKELKKAKDYIKGKTTLYLESSDAKASFYGGQELIEKKIMEPADIFRKIDKVTSSEIRSVARDIFQPQKLNLALIGPFKEKEKNRFRKILKL